MSSIAVVVSAVEQVTPFIKHLTLKSRNGQPLPAFSGGSHVVVAMKINGRTHRNPYSLMGSPADTSAYHIAVRLQEKSRGGSAFIHQQVQVGSELDISYPTNLFAIAKRGRKHVLIAGGIGITPFISQVEDLIRTQADFELHYAFRSPEQGAFVTALTERCRERFHAYADSLGQCMNLEQLFNAQPLGTHVYVCGPSSMVLAVITTARALGWPEHHIHSEQFTAPPVGEPFLLKLAVSNVEIIVPSELSTLEAMEAAGIDAPYLCRGGACGRCELEVLSTDGELLHHDHYLTELEKASGSKIMPCVSRVNCGYLEVNL